MTKERSFPALPMLTLLLLAKALLLAYFVNHSSIGLSPDEAQYWTWSKALDWGYYSKPPGVAWQIFLGTKFFGETPLGVRAPSIAIATLTPLLLYLLARRSTLSKSTAFWSALLLAFSPLGIFSSLLAITDVGMIFFWCASLVVIAEALAEMRPPNYLLLGLLIACGALFKWPIYLLWPLFIAALPLFPSLYSPRFFAGVTLSLLGLLPSLYWNSRNGWATFRHVTASIGGKSEAASRYAGNPLEFVGAQVGLLSPLLFILLLLAFAALWRRRRELPPPLLFSGWVTAALFFLMFTLSLFKKVQGNWVDFAYPTAILLIAWVGSSIMKKGRLWMGAGVALSLLFTLFAVAQPEVERVEALSSLALPYKLNPFKHNVGWDKLPDILDAEGFDPDREFLFSSKYQMCSILSFYSPKKTRAYFLNIYAIRNNQFCYWKRMRDEQLGKDGYYIIAENSPHLERELEKIDEILIKLRPYFEKVEFLGPRTLVSSRGHPVKAALLFKGHKYNGLEPSATESY